MTRQFVVLTATVSVVNFGHSVHPQPPAPDNHILHPDDVDSSGTTIVNGS